MLPSNVQIPKADIVLGGIHQNSLGLDSYRVTNSVDNVGNTATLDFSQKPVGFNSLDYNSPIQIYENDNLVFNGLINAPKRTKDPNRSFGFDCVDWLGRVATQQLDSMGMCFGGYADANGNLVPTSGVSIDSVVHFILTSSGIPSGSISLYSNPYTGNSLYGASSSFLMGSVVPYYAVQTGYWDMIQEILVWNGFTVLSDPDGIIRWRKISVDPVSAKLPQFQNANSFDYYYGRPGNDGYETIDYSRTGDFTYNRVEVIGADATGIYEANGHQCSQVSAIAQDVSPVGLNGYRIIPENPLNKVIDPDSGLRHVGYRPLQIQSNTIDIPVIAEEIAKMILSEVNTIHEELIIEVIPPSSVMNQGDVITVHNDPDDINNGSWVIKQIDNQRDSSSHKYTITLNRGNMGDSRYGAGV